MPIYDVRCLADCGYFHDLYFPVSECDNITCPVCSNATEIIIRTVPTIGPMPSKPLVVKQLGKTFESAKELRDYKRANPDLQFMPSSGTNWQSHKDKVREKANLRCQKAGFNDLKDRQRQMKQRDDHLHRLKQGDKKPFSSG